MKTFLDRMTRNTPDESGSAPLPPGDPSPAAATPPAAAGDPPPPSAGDPSAAAPSPAAAGDLYRPEGLPDAMMGATDKETLDNVTKALKGYRDRDATNAVPETAEAYGSFRDDLPEAVKPHIDTLKGDPLFGRVADKALSLGLSVPAYQGLVEEFVSVSAEMGLMEPIVNVEAERQALIPDAAKHLPAAEQKAAVERRMDENFAFIDAMVTRGPTNGGFSKDVGDFAKSMLGDSAKGHQFFEWAAKVSGGQGGGPAITTGLPQGEDPKKDLQRRGALPQNTVGHRDFDRASYDQLQADYVRVYGK